MRTPAVQENRIKEEVLRIFSFFFFSDLEEKSRAMSAIEEEKTSIASNLQTNQSIIGEYCVQPVDQPVNYRRVFRPTCRPTSQL
jgi:hypothetical protein